MAHQDLPALRALADHLVPLGLRVPDLLVPDLLILDHLCPDLLVLLARPHVSLARLRASVLLHRVGHFAHLRCLILLHHQPLLLPRRS